MARVCSPGVFLITCLVIILELTEASIQRIIHREKNQGMMSYWTPRTYPCMTDWNKICEKDSDCCSGLCLAMFCKIEGVEMPTTIRPRRRGKLRAKGKGKYKGVTTDHSGKSTAENSINNKQIQ